MFNKKSLEILESVDNELKKLMLKAEEEAPFNFIITEGMRTVERQRELVRQKKSWTMKSYHLTGRAVDVAIIIDNKADWNFKNYEILAKHIKNVADNMNIQITWGGDWKVKDGCHFQIEKIYEPKLSLISKDKFELEEEYKSSVVSIDKGFKTDLASIPKFLWSFLSPLEETYKAALTHDFLYSENNKNFTRKEADKIFLEDLKESGVGILKRFLMYSAVRIFGSIFYKGEKK